MGKEKVLFAVRKGNENWEEEVITSTTDDAHLAKAKAWATENGFDRLRIAELDLSQKPDFTKSVKGGA